MIVHWKAFVASRLYDPRQQGKTEGRTEGAEEKAVAIAERLFSSGVDLTTIQQWTGLPMERLLSIQAARAGRAGA